MKVSNEIFLISPLSAKILTYEVKVKSKVESNPSISSLNFLKDTQLHFLHSTSWRYDDELGLIITWLTAPCTKTRYNNIFTSGTIGCGESPVKPAPEIIQTSNVLAHG